MLEAGMKAPDFTLPDKDGKPVSLSDYLGKRVVVYFYSRTIPRAARARPAPLPGPIPSLKP